MQKVLFDEPAESHHKVKPLRQQFLKWVGNKQRFAHEIISYFPNDFGTYYEPFLGSGAVLGTLAPRQAVASDLMKPLIEIWHALQRRPDDLISWYRERWERFNAETRPIGYEAVKASYNREPNGPDLMFLARSCYGGVVRFRQDGYMSTPCGIHDPISPESFASRVALWRDRVAGTSFRHLDFEQSMDAARQGDLIYCDPPYLHTQAILYGAQTFSLERLFDVIARCKRRGVYVALSIDGTKKSGKRTCDISIPKRLFVTEAMVHCGRSMLRRFQLEGEELSQEVVADRLLLTY